MLVSALPWPFDLVDGGKSLKIFKQEDDIINEGKTELEAKEARLE